ncbi:MAG: DNA-directed DNA polymerase [Actinobacteria bacterium]|nr:DNA-directed DNA polymerase [Actinomycetota bacterium]
MNPPQVSVTVARRRHILHLDLDAFYASVETLDNPGLTGKPVIVGGSERRGVVCAASYEARKFGVHSAQPMATAKRLCPGGIFLPLRMKRYQEMSGRVFDIYHRFTPLVEALSIDEAFLDVTDSVRLFGMPVYIAGKIRSSVREETGLTVSAGVAANKLLAKIASDMNKPDGLTVVPPGGEKEFLSPLPVGKLWGVGKVTGETLRRMGVSTIGDLSGVPEDVLERKLGRNGVWLHRLSRGIDDREVESEREARSMGHEDTYPEDLTDMESIKAELLSLSTRVSARMRRNGVKGRTITLKVKYSDFTLVTRADTLNHPSDDGGELYRSVLALLPKTDAGKRPVRLLGISLSNLSAGEEGKAVYPADPGEQLSLFAGAIANIKAPAQPTAAPPSPSPEKREKLNRAVDRIREKFGDTGISPGALRKRPS